MFVNPGTKFDPLVYCFPKEARGSVKFLGKDRRVLAEVDRPFENGSAVMPVEVYEGKTGKPYPGGILPRGARCGTYVKKARVCVKSRQTRAGW